MKSVIILYGLTVFIFLVLVMIATSIIIVIESVERIENEVGYIHDQFINTKLELCE
jgi:hypothetical protein